MLNSQDRSVVRVTLIVVGVLLVLWVAFSLIGERVSAWAGPAKHPATRALPGGGGWEKITSATDLHWMVVNGVERPCRTARVEVHKWGIAGGEVFRVRMRSTACIAVPKPGVVHVGYHAFPLLSPYLCGTFCSITDFDNSAWGTLTSAGRRHVWQVTKVVAGVKQQWYPAIKIGWTVNTNNRNKIALATSAACGGC